MSADKFKSSALWNDIIRTHIGDVSDLDLSDFRNNAKGASLNTRIAAWSIDANAHRFYRSLLFNEAMRLEDRHFQIIDRIRIRDLGRPVTVRVKGRDICVDYLQAALEIDFLSGVLGEQTSVLEIGAGFGRTCHAILENFPNIRRYTIVDLAPCLDLSNAYLGAVLKPEQFEKIRFVDNESIEDGLDDIYGLAININSMAEMDAETVDNYLDLISRNCLNFYSNNPVGKYSPAAIGLDAEPSPSARLAMQTGKLTDVVDIFDDAAVAESVPMFLAAYRPGEDWVLVHDSSTALWSYYHQALYRKSGPVG